MYLEKGEGSTTGYFKKIDQSSLGRPLVLPLWSVSLMLRLLALLFVLGREETRLSVPSRWQGCWGREGRFIVMQGRGRGERVPGPQGLIPELSKTFYQDQKP